jgi:Phage integrase, N-terminal SAM-like domain
VVAPNNRAGRKKPEATLAQLIVDHEHRPIAPKAELGTVADLLDRWLASQAHRLSPKTLAEYRRAARLKIIPHIGDSRLNEVAVSDLDRLYVTLLIRGGEDGQPLARCRPPVARDRGCASHMGPLVRLVWSVRRS